jgi:hypothetical protein
VNICLIPTVEPAPALEPDAVRDHPIPTRFTVLDFRPGGFGGDFYSFNQRLSATPTSLKTRSSNFPGPNATSSQTEREGQAELLAAKGRKDRKENSKTWCQESGAKVLGEEILPADHAEDAEGGICPRMTRIVANGWRISNFELVAQCRFAKPRTDSTQLGAT